MDKKLNSIQYILNETQADFKAIIFDIGGVIFPVQPWIGERPPIEEFLRMKNLIRDIYEPGKMSKEYLKDRISVLDISTQEKEAAYKSLAIIDEDLLELIKSISQKYELYCIANDVKNWTGIRKDLTGFDRYFKKLYISCELGMKKPEEGIYKLFLKETDFNPGECLFIDDKQENVQVAQRLGMQGFIYKDFQGFKDYMQNIAG